MKGEALQQFIFNRLIIIELFSIVCAVFVIYLLNKLLLKRIGFSTSKNVISNYKNKLFIEKNKKDTAEKIRRIILKIRNIKKKTGFDFSTLESRDEMEYLLKRNKIISLDGKNDMNYYEYDAIVTASVIVAVIVSIVFAFLMNFVVAIAFLITALMIILALPKIILADKIKKESAAIQEEFGDYFLNQYNILVGNSKNPIETGFELYKKETQDKSMKEFLTAGLDLIHQHGEFNALEKISAIYKDIPSLNRLLRIEKQMLSAVGESGKKELESVRSEVIVEKRNYTEKRIEKYKTEAAFWTGLIYVLLFQSIIGIMSVFLMNYNM